MVTLGAGVNLGSWKCRQFKTRNNIMHYEIIWEQYGLSKCAFRVYKSDLKLFSISQVSRHWTLGSISQYISITSPLAGMNLPGAVSQRGPCLLLFPEVHPAVGWGKLAWITACLGVSLASVTACVSLSVAAALKNKNMEYNFPGAFDTFYLTAFPIAPVIWEPSPWNPGQRTQAGSW